MPNIFNFNVGDFARHPNTEFVKQANGFFSRFVFSVVIVAAAVVICRENKAKRLEIIDIEYLATIRAIVLSDDVCIFKSALK